MQTSLKTTSQTPIAFFLVGGAGTGKTSLARKWIRRRLAKGEAWAHIDRDQVSGLHTPKMLELMGASPNDRDSPVYKAHLRDLDYGAALVVAGEQLDLGLNVMLPGPWTRELYSGALFTPGALGLPEETRVAVVQLTLSAKERRRVIETRAHPADAWKLENWDAYLAANPDKAPPAGVLSLDTDAPTEALLDELDAALARVP